jgi:undecaprenyl pyrophosphate synthase
VINSDRRGEYLRAVRKIAIDERQNCSWESIHKKREIGNIPDVDLFVQMSREQELTTFFAFTVGLHGAIFTRHDELF